MLSLPQPSLSYDRVNEAQARAAIEANDKQIQRKTADVEIVRRRLILQSPNGDLWSVVVSNSGVLSASAI